MGLNLCNLHEKRSFKKLIPECTRSGVEESMSPWQVMSDQRILPLHWHPKPAKQKTVYTCTTINQIKLHRCDEQVKTSDTFNLFSILNVYVGCWELLRNASLEMTKWFTQGGGGP